MATLTITGWQPNTPLHWAAQDGDLKTLLLAIKKATHLNPEDEQVPHL